jgi:C-terminal processing protease CtpA/Prc
LISIALPAALAAALPACGDNIEGVPDEILSEDLYAGRCQSPRTGNDPLSGMPFNDSGGSLLDEQLWIRSWTNDLYLWYREVPDPDPRSFATATDYFDVMKTPATTASGKPKDQFHFFYDTSFWESLSGSGIEAGYGIQWELLSTSPPRELVVALVQPGSPAEAAGLTRGTHVQAIDGVDLVAGKDTDTLNHGISPAAAGETHSFVVYDPGSATPRTVSLVSADISLTPVQNVHMLPPPADKVGYMLFTDHIATAEQELVDGVTLLRNAGATDLVLDLRYNGGGYLDIAAELGYMIAGPTATAGKIFERETFNDKHPTIDPVTGDPLTPSLFLSHALGFSASPGLALPYLGLTRVFVLTGPGTCSASEAVMNGLSGAGIEVIQIGETTCGKPYGFYPADNCGTTYFAIQFQGVNNQGFGDYADGFIPGARFHGCMVSDDFTHALGDPAEARLATALAYRANAACPAVVRRSAAVNPLAAGDGVAIKPAWRQNRIIGHPSGGHGTGPASVRPGAVR